MQTLGEIARSKLTVADLSGSTWDSDALKAERHKGAYTDLSFALNVCMAVDDAAQERYLAIWGRPWSPVPALGEEELTLVGEVE